MKRFLLTLTLITFTFIITGQLPVTDATLAGLMIEQSTMRTEANVTIGKQLIEASEQTKRLSDTYRLMKEANDKLKEVSTFIAKFSSIANILNNQKYQYNRIKKAVERFSDSKYVTVNELRVLQRCSTRFLKNTNELIGLANDVVTPHKSEMNDAERISLLIKINEKMDSESSAIDYTIRNLEEIEDQRAAMAGAENVMKKVFVGK
ncbi:hypothetical protein SAMN06265379_11253 [Saccharicrinis carchari]|uniref:Conjugal transfer protein TraI n=1 Tax=Saccharicrinis carchari TaxID=1168039 RepID=A0A521EZX1_SACCC|nr:hypothetical protein [Saccharicrinis carchari]SMO89562.1 hypothetical protein SAMN06265379_11253 [Saccharicrinis carchari]